MRTPFLLLSLLLLPTRSEAQLQVELSLPTVSLGLAVPSYPELEQVPGYPVYYDPRASSNYFFYDGGYWVYQDDRWYSSEWYDGPWMAVGPEEVPLYVLRIPVRYYRRPPAAFAGWQGDAPPRWGERWGREWEGRRPGWDRWDRAAAPPPAPLPTYQRHYTGGSYPRGAAQQRTLRAENYRYQPRERVAPRQPAPARSEPQAPPSRQERPSPQERPQARPSERRAEPQARPPEVRSAPEARPSEHRSEPQPRPSERRAEPQPRPPERRAEPQQRPSERRDPERPGDHP
jgi:hypothetical protein